MAVITVTKESFQSVVELPGIVFLDFWAEWCPPCRMFKPTFEKAADKNPDITFASINTEKEVELAGFLGISSIPTIVAFRDSIPVYAQPGALPASEFNRLIDDVRGLDMDVVRAQMAADDPSDDTCCDSEDDTCCDSSDEKSDSACCGGAGDDACCTTSDETADSACCDSSKDTVEVTDEDTTETTKEDAGAMAAA
ncbi:MAG: thioredoxin family protein [Propionibacteriaceae bacterium]|nr:thioredoxin family protein [Propionibacteriaceae bacterium]